MLKIAFIYYDRPNYCGGPVVNAQRLLPELVRRGYDVTALVGYRRSFPSKEFMERHGIAVRALEWPRFVDDQVRWLTRQLRDIDPDIFVPNISASGCYAARYLREAGRPTIAAHRSNDQFNWGMAERFCQKQDEWAVSALFCVSDELTRGVMTWRPEKTIVKTIPSGVPIPSRVADPTGPLRIVYAGRLEERQKRIGATVSALIDSMARHPELTVKIIGEGSQLPSVQRQVAESGYENRFQLTGYIPPQDLHNEILDGNVFVLLSDFEGLPGGVMDAMACGLVPVCSDIPGGVRELVVHEQTGLLITDRENSFQAAISRLNAEPQLRTRLSTNARKHIEQGFSLTITADRWEELFRQAMAASGPRLPISFPKRISLPAPYPGIAREDIRRPPFFRRAIQVSLALPGRTARWVTRGLSNKH